jgi:hypothetical protein
LERWAAAVQTSREIREAAAQHLSAVEADYNAARTSLDLLLRTRIALIEAELECARSASAYKRAVTEYHFRTGGILEHNAVGLAEAPEESADEPGMSESGAKARAATRTDAAEAWES